MTNKLRAKNNTLVESDMSSNLAIIETRETLVKPFSSENIDNDADLLSKLESIEKEMLNGEGIPFKDVNELAKRYGL